MNGPTMRALRETVGMSVRTLAQLAGVQERTIKRWESGAAPVPADVAQIVTDAKERQDEVVSFALAQYEALYDQLPEGSDFAVELRYWVTERDYLERSTDAALGVDGDWLMANATTRRCAAVLEDIGIRVTYTSDELPRNASTPTLTLVD
jgi:transcriptional regulator with XRE-family HTH domain